MMVGFPPFHCVNKKNLYKRITTGSLRFPPNLDEDAKDLISWLLEKDPSERPIDFDEIKKHQFFFDIHWGRIAKKEAIPPWIPDLYTLHAPKLASLNQVFHKNTCFKEQHRTSHNPRKQSNEEFKGSLYVHDHNSGRQKVLITEKIEDSIEDMLYLQGKPH
jgi:serine/threonine protein kinase